MSTAQIPMNYPTPRTDNYPKLADPLALCYELERELTEALHLKERAESSLSGASARFRKAQDDAEIWEKKFIQQKAEEKWANRTAFLTNPLHDVLDEMDSRGGNAIQRLAAYIRACDPERRSKALIAFRDDLECYDRKLTPPEKCQRCGGCFMIPGEGPDDDVMNTACPDCNPQPVKIPATILPSTTEIKP